MDELAFRAFLSAVLPKSWLFLPILIGAIWITWSMYLMMMPLKRAQSMGTMTTTAKIFGYPWVAVFILLDFMFNIVFGTIIFAKWPQDYLLTERLNRYLDGRCGLWRRRLARYFCREFLDPFDPDGHHCSK